MRGRLRNPAWDRRYLHLLAISLNEMFTDCYARPSRTIPRSRFVGRSIQRPSSWVSMNCDYISIYWRRNCPNQRAVTLKIIKVVAQIL